MEFKSFEQIFNECNNVSQFKGSTQKIIDNACAKLDVIRKTYKDEYVGPEIKKVLQQAEKELNKNRDTFLSLLRTELDKNAQLIPNNLCEKDYSDKQLKLLEYKMKCMTNDELLAYNNSTDEVAVIIAKGMLAERCNVLEGQEKQNLFQAMRTMQPTTKESILEEQLQAYRSIDYNALFPGDEFGIALSKYAQGGLEGIILNKMGIEKINVDKPQNVNEHIGGNVIDNSLR